MSQDPFWLEILEHPDSLWARSLYAFRTDVLRHVKAGKKSFLITSSWEGEGKSLVVANLGAALALMGRAVILIDCDLRRPTLSWAFQMKRTAGVREALEQPEAVPTQPTPVPHLQILPAGDMSGRVAADLIASPELKRVIQALMKQCDCLLVDTPPLSVCSDARLVGRWCEGAYIVVREDKFIGDREGHFAEDLRDCGVPLLGCVLNASKDVKEVKERKRVRRGWR